MSTRASTSAPVRLLFVDDSRIQRGLWTRLLSQSSEITVVGALESAEEIPTALASLRSMAARPNVVLAASNPYDAAYLRRAFGREPLPWPGTSPRRGSR